MNGAECLLRTLLVNDVDLCLMNPGTSEMQFVSALDRVPAMRGVLGLFEGVCSGAADGYARMTGKPASVLLHLGPGLGYALSNLHNAKKARSPVVNIVGEHSTQHLAYDAPLSADIEAFARPVSAWVHTLREAGQMGMSAAAAVEAAWPGNVSTLIVPADYSWSEAGEPGAHRQRPARALPAPDVILQIAEVLRKGGKLSILLNGQAQHERGLRAAHRLRALTGVRIFAARYGARLSRGGNVPAVERIPYFPEPAQALLSELERMILVEAKPPVSFFGYPNLRSTLAPPGCIFDVLAEESQDGTAALEWLCDELGAPRVDVQAAQPGGVPTGSEPLTAAAIGRTVAALAPEGAVFSDEAVSSSEQLWPHLAYARQHDHLPNTGGSIGQGLPVALGAALACPDRKVISFEGDGSAMYTFQALWTMARESLDVTVIIMANRRYRILDVEMTRTGSGPVGNQAERMIDLKNPLLQWVDLARGLGVPATQAATVEEFVAAFAQAMHEPGPKLIEALL